MLKHMGLPKFASDIEHALSSVYKYTAIRTKDIGGQNTSDEFTDEVIKFLGSKECNFWFHKFYWIDITYLIKVLLFL